MIPSHIDTGALDLCLLFSPFFFVLLDPLLLLSVFLDLTPGANVSTIIFCEVSLKLLQSIDLNIRLALLIS